MLKQYFLNILNLLIIYISGNLLAAERSFPEHGINK
jgi:hypothetical protein